MWNSGSLMLRLMPQLGSAARRSPRSTRDRNPRPVLLDQSPAFGDAEGREQRQGQDEESVCDPPASKSAHPAPTGVHVQQRSSQKRHEERADDGIDQHDRNGLLEEQGKLRRQREEQK